MADCTQKLQATIGLSAAVESWQTGFNSSAYRSARSIFYWADGCSTRCDLFNLVPRCPVWRCQSLQFWWSRDIFRILRNFCPMPMQEFVTPNHGIFVTASLAAFEHHFTTQYFLFAFLPPPATQPQIHPDSQSYQIQAFYKSFTCILTYYLFCCSITTKIIHGIWKCWVRSCIWFYSILMLVITK